MIGKLKARSFVAETSIELDDLDASIGISDGAVHPIAMLEARRVAEKVPVHGSDLETDRVGSLKGYRVEHGSREEDTGHERELREPRGLHDACRDCVTNEYNVMSSMNEPLLHFLDWDSEFFGKQIYRANVDRLDEAVVRRISTESRERGADCVYLLVDSEAMHQASLVENVGFRLMDARVTLGTELSESFRPESSPAVRHALEDDVADLEAIAAVSHTDSRFYADPRLAAKAPELYRVWIAKSVRADEELVLVADVSGKAVGYFTAHRTSKDSGQIGLVGVGAEARGRGFGRALMQGALGWFREGGMHRVEVVTQARNLAAQRLYQRSGFVTKNVQLWFHKWFD